MEATTSLLFWLVIILLIVQAFNRNRNKKQLTSDRSTGDQIIPTVKYRYRRKPFIMTKTENEFYDVLRSGVGDGYLIFPQVHLSSILDHKVKAQNWEHALRYINQKSVDYVVCDRVFRKPLVAIELDDWSHNSDSRKQRDATVEHIFTEAGIPLLRFKDVHTLSRADIEARLKEALSQAEHDGRAQPTSAAEPTD